MGWGEKSIGNTDGVSSVGLGPIPAVEGRDDVRHPSVSKGGGRRSEGFELPTNRRKRKPRNEAGARRVRKGVKNASQHWKR